MADYPVKEKTVTCIYVFRGKEIHKKQVVEHPGMEALTLDEYRHDKQDTRVLFTWDHLNARGEHIFWGTELRK